VVIADLLTAAEVFGAVVLAGAVCEALVSARDLRSRSLTGRSDGAT
jgi:hypothetical protein